MYYRINTWRYSTGSSFGSRIKYLSKHLSRLGKDIDLSIGVHVVDLGPDFEVRIIPKAEGEAAMDVAASRTYCLFLHKDCEEQILNFLGPLVDAYEEMGLSLRVGRREGETWDVTVEVWVAESKGG